MLYNIKLKNVMAYKRESPIHMYANTNSMDEKNKTNLKNSIKKT